MTGRSESCVYLVNCGDQYTILGGGLTYIVPDMVSQIENLGIDVKKIKQIIIHHSHFDHVGIVPCLSKMWPWIEIVASAKGTEFLTREDIVKKIVSLNRMFLSQADPSLEYLYDSLDIKTIEVDRTVSDGDIIHCGDMELLILDVPGHSPCSMAVYIPEEKILSASDAGGIPYGDRILTAANSNFDLYQKSLEKMAAYPCDIHLSEHYGALTGEDGRNFMAESIKEAAEMRQLIESTYENFQDEKKTVTFLVDKISSEVPDYFLPKELISMIMGQMTHFIVKQYKK